MNERIRELAIKTGFNTVEFNPGGDRVVFYGVDMEADGRLQKFAELIIRECVQESLKSSHRDDDMGAIIARHITKHFGVEE